MQSPRSLAFLVPAAVALVLGVDALAGDPAGNGNKEKGKAPPASEGPPVLEILVPDLVDPAASLRLDFGNGEWKDLEGWVASAGSGRILTPAVDGTRVFVGSGIEMNCYMAMGGKRGWSTKVDDSAPSAPAVEDGHVYFNTGSCTLYDLNAETGARVWSQWVAGSVATTPAVADGRVFVSGPAEGGGFKLEAYSAKSGKLLFRNLVKSDLISAPVADGERVYYALCDGTLAAATDAGEPLWETSSKAVSAPVPVDGRLLVATASEDGDAGLLDVDSATGNPVGRRVATPAPLPPSPPEKQGMFLGDLPNRGGAGPGAAGPKPGPAAAPKDPLRDRPTGPGKGGKKNPPQAPGAPTPATGSGPPPAPYLPGVGGFGYEGPRPVVAGRTAALAGSGSLLLRELDEDRERRIPIADRPAGPPAAAGAFFVQATCGGRLLLVEAASGEIRFEMRFRTAKGDVVPFSSSPSVSRGRAYIGTADGRILGVDLPMPGLDGWPMWGGNAGRGK